MSNVPSQLPVGAQPAPNLTDIVADPAALDCLPAAALIAIRRQAYGLVADLEQAVTERLLAGPGGSGALSDLGVLTTGRLANLWGMKDAKIRELCRTGQIPARKLAKEWVVPVKALHEWARQTIADRTGGRHNAADNVRLQRVASPVRPHRVEVRRPAPPIAPPADG